MNLISYEFGQTLQPIRMEEVRPLSGLYLPDVLNAIGDRYRFISKPVDIGAAAANGAKFETGTIDLGGRAIAVGSLGIYNDGLLVVCRNTDDSDIVVDNFLDWATETFGLRPSLGRLTRQHASQVIVEFDTAIDKLVAGFAAVARMFETALEASQGVKIDAHVHRIALSADPSEGLPLTQTSFIIEARAGVPFSAKRYYSGAPVKSSIHLKLLESIEKMCAAEN